KIKEPTAIVAVLIFAIIFMVGFGIWHAPLLDFASQALPDLANVASVAPRTS
ncbi:MAG: nuoN, partial [Nitrososphaeraceae archaeon]|nr:nuoN [Nitrososphaeraceae archaeon]MCD6036610.1 nuoN [Nitrososphaeraceae archaeon]MDF2768939.1 nuoN [Nitrososphaeraceae archaeon]